MTATTLTRAPATPTVETIAAVGVASLPMHASLQIAEVSTQSGYVNDLYILFFFFFFSVFIVIFEKLTE